MAISVNMFQRQRRMDCQPRWKNGRPPQSTTGVASASSTQARTLEDILRMTAPAPSIPAMPANSSGTVSAAQTQNRRVIDSSAAFGNSTAPETTRGSSAMPQIGQSPGPRWTICGSIGQVYSTPASADDEDGEDEDAGGCATGGAEACTCGEPRIGNEMPEGCGRGARYFSGEAANLSAQPRQQKK